MTIKYLIITNLLLTTTYVRYKTPHDQPEHIFVN